MSARNFVVLTICVVLCISTTETARILGMFPSPSKSHLLVHMGVAKALADAGHNVTVVTAMPYSDPNPNYRVIKLDIEGISPTFMAEMVNNPKPFYQRFSIMSDKMLNGAEEAYLHPEMQRLMAEESFDLVIIGYFMNEFYLGVAAHFKCPVILNFMIQPISMLNSMIGNPSEVSYVPNVFTGLKAPMGFVKRVKNFIYTEIVELIMFRGFYDYKSKGYYQKHFPEPKYPSYEDMKKNISLLMVNHHFSQGPIRPNVPALIEIGGIQIKEKLEPLPQDIQTFLDSADESGVIYFSFGSNVDGSLLNKEKTDIIFNVLSKLPQKVLMKWDDGQYPGKSGNILYKSWFPQDSVLAHPKVKLFITHGGQGSIVEAQYHGVPMVGVPLFGDQSSNMATVEKSGFGVALDFLTLSEESLSAAIAEVLTNEKYSQKIAKFAEIYKDRPMSARATVTYWVDYVLRHRGAPHMQSPLVHMNWFQEHSLDVLAFLLVVVLIVAKIFIVIVRFIFRKAFGKKPATQTGPKVKTN